MNKLVDGTVQKFSTLKFITKNRLNKKSDLKNVQLIAENTIGSQYLKNKETIRKQHLKSSITYNSY